MKLKIDNWKILKKENLLLIEPLNWKLEIKNKKLEDSKENLLLIEPSLKLPHPLPLSWVFSIRLWIVDNSKDIQ